MLKVRNGSKNCGIEKKVSVQLYSLVLKPQKIQMSHYSPKRSANVIKGVPHKSSQAIGFLESIRVVVCLSCLYGC